MPVTGSVGGTALVLAGSVDVLSVAELRDALHTAVDAGVGDLRVDVRQLRFPDSTGLGALLSAHRRARRAGRRLVLTGVSEELARLLQRSRLGRVIAVDLPDGGPATVLPLPLPLPRPPDPPAAS
jgi:anti-anti-sigma factor